MTNRIDNNIIANAGLNSRGNWRAPVFERGQIIEALVTQRNDLTVRLSELSSGQTFDLPSGDVRGNPGDTLAFEVLSHNRQGLALRQIVSNQNEFQRQLAKAADLASLEDLMEANNFVDRDVDVLDYDEAAERNMDKRDAERRALSALRRQTNFAAGNATRAAVLALLAEGVDVTKLSLETLNNMLNAIKQDAGIDVRANSGDNPEDLLERTDVPLTRRNIAAAADAARKLGAIADMDKDSILTFLRTGGDGAVSIDNLYKYAVAGGNATEAAPDVPLPEIEKALARQDIAPTPDNMESAKLLVQAEVPLTKDNLDKYEFLTNIDGNGDEILTKAALAKAMGEDMTAADIYKPSQTLSREDFAEIFRQVSVITPRHIDLAVMQNIPLTIRDLAFLADNTAESAHDADTAASSVRARARLDLAEISLRLTYESANRLYSQGIKIDVLTLSEAVNALKAAEGELFGAKLQALGAADSAEGAALASEAVYAAKKLKGLPDVAFGDIMTERVAFTMRGLSDYGVDPAALAERYAPFEASPKAKYGDTLQNAAEKFAHLLESMDIEATAANVRAARILAANAMELTRENLLTVKAIDAKLTDLSNSLHPFIAVHMVKDGLNPLDMTIDRVLDYISSFGGAYGEDMGDTLAGHIYAMDRSKSMAPEEREALMAIYRALHIIRKNGAQSLGAALNADASLTLGTLLSMSETFNKVVNISAGDEHSLTYKETSGTLIRDILTKNDAEYYADRLVEGVIRNAAPEALSNAVNTDNATGQSLEALMENLADAQLPKAQADMAQAEVLAGEITALEDVNAALLKELQDAGVPLTAANIGAYRKVAGGRLFGGGSAANITRNERARQVLDGKVADTSLSSATDFGDYIKEMYDALMGAADEDLTDLSRLNEITDSLRLLYNTSAVSARGHYLPVKFNGRISDVNVYVLNENVDVKQDITIAILLHSAMGETRMHLTMRGDAVAATMSVNGVDVEGLDEALAAADAGKDLRALDSLPKQVRHAAAAALAFAEALEAERLN